MLTSVDLLRTCRGEFRAAYDLNSKPSANLASCMELGIPSTQRTEFYDYDESAPEPVLQDRHEDMAEDTIASRVFSVTNLKYSRAIWFHEDDVEDRQTGGIATRARTLGSRFAMIPERVFALIAAAGTNRDLLRALPLAPDGAALFATTAGGVARFGATGGNLLTGNGVATGAAIRKDFWLAYAQFLLFQGTEGEPLLESVMDNATFTIRFNASLLEVFSEAFRQERTMQLVTESSANVGGAAVSNTLVEAGRKYRLWPTSRITDSDWEIYIDAPGVKKPIFEQKRRAVRVIEETVQNSREARRNGKLAITATMRSGFGIAPAFGAIKINN